MGERYSVPRVCIKWEGNELLEPLKMLVHVVKDQEHLTGARLERRTWELYPEVMQHFVGRRVSREEARTHAQEKYGADITRNRLVQRADKVSRYSEFGDGVAMAGVRAAYREITSGVAGKLSKEGFPLDPCRHFSDDQFKRAIEIFGDECYYCKRPRTNMFGLVADHHIAHAKGGPTKLFNCRPACQDCNGRKGDMDPSEFMLIECGKNRGRDI